MAGQAQKKAAKAASSTGRFYGFLLLVVNAVYCLWLASQALNGACAQSCVRAALRPTDRHTGERPSRDNHTPTLARKITGTDRWAAYKAWSLTRKVFVWGGGAFCYWCVRARCLQSVERHTYTRTH